MFFNQKKRENGEIYTAKYAKIGSFFCTRTSRSTFIHIVLFRPFFQVLGNTFRHVPLRVLLKSGVFRRSVDGKIRAIGERIPPDICQCVGKRDISKALTPVKCIITYLGHAVGYRYGSYFRAFPERAFSDLGYADGNSNVRKRLASTKNRLFDLGQVLGKIHLGKTLALGKRIAYDPFYAVGNRKAF